MPATSGSFSVSAESTMAMTCVSQRNPSGNKRPDGPVNLAAGQNFALAGPPFALDEAARNASGSIGVLAVIDGEGEEVNALTGVRVGAGGGENNVVADAHNAGTVGLLG